MAIQRGEACYLLLAVLLSLQLTEGVLAGGAGDITVYWGQGYRYEDTLRQTCDTGLYKTVVISFLSAFGDGYYKLDLSGNPTFDIGNDIKHCKSKGIVVLLSIGGHGSEYSLPSNKSAADVGDYLWNAFLGGSRAGVDRPFGDAAVDGIDFFIDQGAMEHYDELARRLYSYTRYNRVGQRIVLTATPRCGYPDPHLNAALDTNLFNRIHVRLYSLYGLDRPCTTTPWDSWLRWAVAYLHTKVAVGVVALSEGDYKAYLSPRDLNDRVLHAAKQMPNYGGVMIWNRAYDKLTNYTRGL